MLKLSPMYREMPEETVEIAQAAFPKGTVFMQMRDHRGRFIGMKILRLCFPDVDNQQ